MSLVRHASAVLVPALIGADRAGLPWDAPSGGRLIDSCVGTTLVADLIIASPDTETYECGLIVPDGLAIEIADGAALVIEKVS